ncbi:MAG TPA: hypothetical protein DEO84_10895 [candidate division Zixibacteria bacterium]|nr:hypothetical protein [candidate division Zixibacteria bacterium]
MYGLIKLAISYPFRITVLYIGIFLGKVPNRRSCYGRTQLKKGEIENTIMMKTEKESIMKVTNNKIGRF